MVQRHARSGRISFGRECHHSSVVAGRGS
jgi:hypothetical protein